ncbi:MAG: hypothetical protein HFE74_01260 [Firmicutes bacterium]|nr:hypothetical protein [Bacillota bacterium]
MKRKHIVVAVLVIIAILFTTVFAMAGSDEKIVRDLINERTETLNNYYDGSLQREEAASVIRKIETGNLMEQDLDNIDRYFQTDIDRIKEFELINIDITESSDEMICADIYIRWDVETLTGNDSFMCDYNIICIKEGETYKLAQFF